jgi:GAF domain-containing protein
MDAEAAEPQVAADGLAFPQAARLELDELLEQLILRARDVQATQGRLRALLRANQAVASAVDLEEVLRHILEAARQLVEAEYAALGVIEQGRLVRFLHVGLTPGQVAAIGHLPEGKGLLGRLIDYPQPLRLSEISAHVASVGFPDHHPPMRSFLGVPIRVGTMVFGNLYLTNKHQGAEFTQEDQELVTALAAAAGVAITNAGQFADTRRRQQWQTAMAGLSTALLTSGNPDEAPGLILRYAADAIDAAGISVAVPAQEPGQVKVAAAEGLFAALAGLLMSTHDTIYGKVMAERQTLVIADLGTESRTAVKSVTGAGPTVALPMRTELATNGVLFVSRAVGQTPFDRVDIEMLEAYASHAALVLQLAQTRWDREQLQRVDELRGVAEQLHGDVVQRLSRLGLDLQGLTARITDERVRAELQSKVDETDQIIRALRTAIFGLGPA